MPNIWYQIREKRKYKGKIFKMSEIYNNIQKEYREKSR